MQTSTSLEGRQHSRPSYFSNAGFSGAIQSGFAAMQNSFRALHHQSRFASLACRQNRHLVNALYPFQTGSTLMTSQLGTSLQKQNPYYTYYSAGNTCANFDIHQQQIPVYSLSNSRYHQNIFLNHCHSSYTSQLGHFSTINAVSRFWGTAAGNPITEMPKRKRSHTEHSRSDNQSKTESSGNRDCKKDDVDINSESKSKQQKHSSVTNMHSQSKADSTANRRSEDVLKSSSPSQIHTRSHSNRTPSPPGCSGQRHFSTTTQSASEKDHPPPSDRTRQSGKSTNRFSGEENQGATANFPLPPGKSTFPLPPGKGTFPLPPGKDNLLQRSSSSITPRDSASVDCRGPRKPRIHEFRRQWKDTKLGRTDKKHRKKAQDRGMEFIVMSYNLLAQNLIHMNDYLYKHCASNILDWNYRKHNLMQEIADINADIICLQEVQGIHYEDFYEPEMKHLGYVGLFKQRTGDKRDGCATFYKRSRFDLVNFKLLEYRQPGIQMLNRDNVAVVVLLQPKGRYQSERLCITNTHLLYNPKRGDIKLAQLSMLLAEVDKIAHLGNAGKSTYHPVIMCGDYNSVPDCPLVEFVQTGQLDYEGLRTIDVSGQERWRSSRSLECPLWPDGVGVTDKCQYKDVGLQRIRHQNPATAANLPSGHNDNTNSSSTSNKADNSPQEAKPDFSSRLQHPFKFDSAYPHHKDCREITTNHCRTNSKVDYIFYDTNQLDVFSRLSLFTDQDAEDMGGLPNARWSSDHFSLAVQFHLSPNDASLKK